MRRAGCGIARCVGRPLWFPALAPDHPRDEDLSAGTPVTRKNGARGICSWSRTGFIEALAKRLFFNEFAVIQKNQGSI